jgi:hypothetical protein
VNSTGTTASTMGAIAEATAKASDRTRTPGKALTDINQTFIDTYSKVALPNSMIVRLRLRLRISSMTGMNEFCCYLKSMIVLSRVLRQDSGAKVS